MKCMNDPLQCVESVIVVGCLRTFRSTDADILWTLRPLKLQVWLVSFSFLPAAPPAGHRRISAPRRSARQVAPRPSLCHAVTSRSHGDVFSFNLSPCSGVNDVLVEEEENDDPQDAEGRTSRLWVDRFSPRHYTELLSDDVRHVVCLCVCGHTHTLWVDGSS